MSLIISKEFMRIAEKVIKLAPIWLKKDIIEIVEKEGDTVRVSHAISILYKKYSFSLGHIFTAMDKSANWSKIANDRLNYIDNKLDVIDLMLYKAKNHTLEVDEDEA